MGEYKTPGVYIKEKNAFGNSIVEAETAIPVFIGLTEIAQDGNTSLLNKPVRISSMTEYEIYFGGAPTPTFTVNVSDKKEEDTNKTLYVYDEQLATGIKATLNGNLCTLHYHMTMFFANGGGTCYVVSMGNYKQELSTIYSDTTKKIVFDNIQKEQDITMLVVPEAVNGGKCMDIYTDLLLKLCNSKKYFVILDVPIVDYSTEKSIDNPIENFRNKIGSNNLQFAAAYYPWLNTSVLSDNDINENILVWDTEKKPDKKIWGENSNLQKYFEDCFDQIISKDSDAKTIEKAKTDLHNALLQNLPLYKLLAKKVKDYLNRLPPSAAMAGIYTMVDNTRGVWKAPANVSVNYVNKPAIPITDEDQKDLNMPMTGKAINAIRTFPGEGIKVWGARTLDGNSQDWRYINVRRTMTFLEQSIKNAARAYVFEPNDANTWINMQCMIESFLRSVWKRGGLAGATPEDAYEVHVGLGDTMTAEDILEGIMRITVLVAISHPAEFIEITFQQQMQKS
ncbi:phage tail sheath family protein [Parabacteroides sp.]